MTDWTKGNKPYSNGLYWVTVNEGGTIKMYDDPMYYDRDSNSWFLNNKKYFADNIIAHLRSNKPAEPYNENHIGFPDQYYLKIIRGNSISYLAKGYQSVSWSKIGYATREKALAAAKRYKKSELEMGSADFDVIIINGNGETV